MKKTDIHRKMIDWNLEGMLNYMQSLGITEAGLMISKRKVPYIYTYPKWRKWQLNIVYFYRSDTWKVFHRPSQESKVFRSPRKLMEFLKKFNT